MIISAPIDYREAARRRLPRFLFDYIDGGAVTEQTMSENITALSSVTLRQQVLCGVGAPTLSTNILGLSWVHTCCPWFGWCNGDVCPPWGSESCQSCSRNEDPLYTIYCFSMSY